jgi:predicted  nucleic acid-binding Zn-ribbon protein
MNRQNKRISRINKLQKENAELKETIAQLNENIMYMQDDYSTAQYRMENRNQQLRDERDRIERDREYERREFESKEWERQELVKKLEREQSSYYPSEFEIGRITRKLKNL